MEQSDTVVRGKSRLAPTYVQIKEEDISFFLGSRRIIIVTLVRRSHYDAFLPSFLVEFGRRKMFSGRMVGGGGNAGTEHSGAVILF